MVAYKTKYGIMLPLVVVVLGGRSFISGLPWRIIQFNDQELNKGLVLKLTHRCWVSLGNQTLNVLKIEISDGNLAQPVRLARHVFGVGDS